MTLHELIQLCKPLGPWQIGPFGRLRNHEELCPIVAAARAGFTTYPVRNVTFMAAGKLLGFSETETNLIAAAADMPQHNEIREILLRELLG